MQPAKIRLNLKWRVAALLYGLKDAIAYRGEFFLEMISSALGPAIIQWIFWYALFKTGGNETVAGMTYKDLIQYTLYSVLFTQIRGGNHDFHLADRIRTGGLSQYLLRPASVVEFVYLQGIAPRLLNAGFCLLGGVVLSFILDYSLTRMFGAMILALLGNLIHYQVGAVLATLAFYWEEAYSVLMVKNLFVALLSGEMIPLNFFPESWSWMWKSLPFYLYVFGPVQYATGKWSHSEFLNAVGIACLWIVFLSFMVHWSWRIGIKKYQSLGG